MRRLIVVGLVLALALWAVSVAQAWTIPDRLGTDTLSGPGPSTPPRA